MGPILSEASRKAPLNAAAGPGRAGGLRRSSTRAVRRGTLFEG